MPRRIETEDAESRAIRELSDEDAQTLNTLTLQAGPPPDAERMSEADEDNAWSTMDPNLADHEQLAQMLATQGLPPELAQKLLITKLRGDDGWLQTLTQPTGSLDTANQLIKLAKYPFRLSVLDNFDDPEAQVRKAESMDRRYQKQMAAHLDQPVRVGGYGPMGQVQQTAPSAPAAPQQPTIQPQPAPVQPVTIGG